ncbi:MAG: AmmeMemoRadiSam system protein B [Sulfolobales archaeon]|nr:AmmeMemoRadiSam system protein B [Sulfolobales archaeon]MCX8208836.1 AmmeMemoRadiSam system protein B [Sulfolobales archaeon]MDW8010139.1 AmmeMemoRadiSam system protein B [Sulfolobales archaeon]
MNVRRAVVAGQFYENNPRDLVEQIESCFLHELGPRELPKAEASPKRVSLGFVVPHAGYMYSGPAAAHAYYAFSLEKKPTTVVLIGPNHTGVGPSVSVYPDGYWETPLGRVPVDSELTKLIVEKSKFARLDTAAHEYEHSLEVQLPFIQYTLKTNFNIVPITILNQTPRVAEDLAKAVLSAIQTLRRDLFDVVVIATSDLTHYEPHEVAYRKDRLVIEKITSLDPEGLFRVVVDKGISMCGPGSAMALIYLAKAVNAGGVRLLKYITSGDVTGEKSWVVGYASIQILW